MINSSSARYIGRTSVGPSSPGLDPVTRMSRVFAPSQKSHRVKNFCEVWNNSGLKFEMKQTI